MILPDFNNWSLSLSSDTATIGPIHDVYEVKKCHHPLLSFMSCCHDNILALSHHKAQFDVDEVGLITQFSLMLTFFTLLSHHFFALMVSGLMGYQGCMCIGSQLNGSLMRDGQVEAAVKKPSG